MTAYVILIRENVPDDNEYKRYRRLVPSSLEGTNWKALIQSRISIMEVLEGPMIEGVSVISFPSMEEARVWYHSEGYQAAVRERQGVADCRLIIVEGLDGRPAEHELPA